MSASLANFSIEPVPARPVVLMGPGGAIQYASNRFTPYYSTAVGTVTVLSGAGVLHSVNVIGGPAGSVAIWDSAGPTGSNGNTLFATGSLGPVGYTLDALFNNGLVMGTYASTGVLITYQSP